MTKDKFNYEKTMTAMLIRWIDGLPFLQDTEKAFVLEFAYAFKQYREELFNLYDAIVNEKEIKGDRELITYKIYDEKNEIGFNNKSIRLSKENLKRVISTIIDFSEKILPLGSVVTLKKDVLDAAIEEEINFIISHRFLIKEGTSAYFTYGGVLYPEGTFKEEKILHFNASAIREVVFEGFNNEKEDAFIAAIKNELILKKGMHSINFATKEERKKF